MDRLRAATELSELLANAWSNDRKPDSLADDIDAAAERMVKGTGEYDDSQIPPLAFAFVVGAGWAHARHTKQSLKGVVTS